MFKKNIEKVKSELIKENCDWAEFKFNMPIASHILAEFGKGRSGLCRIS